MFHVRVKELTEAKNKENKHVAKKKDRSTIERENNHQNQQKATCLCAENVSSEFVRDLISCFSAKINYSFLCSCCSLPSTERVSG